jgi:5-methylcytosine-specific restriction endonuclease McrA
VARYRTIDVRMWSDERFRALWNQRWEAPSSVPKSYGWPRELGRFNQREETCLQRRHRFQQIKRKLWTLVLARLGNVCLICGIKEATVLDHVIPIRWGGTNDLENFQPACSSCNSRKGGDLPIPPNE